MGQQRKRGRSIDPAVHAEIKILARGDLDIAPAAIAEHLERKFDKALVPSSKTIGRVVSETRYRDSSGVWTLGDKEIDADDAALILPVIAAGPVTRQEAQWVVRVRRAVPDLPTRAVIHVVRAYMSFEHQGQSTEALDFLLALAPWRTAKNADDSAWTDARTMTPEWLEAIYLGRHIIITRDTKENRP